MECGKQGGHLWVLQLMLQINLDLLSLSSEQSTEGKSMRAKEISETVDAMEFACVPVWACDQKMIVLLHAVPLS